MASNYEARYSKEEKMAGSSKGEEKRECFDLEESDIEQNGGDDEKSTMSDLSELFSDDSFTGEKHAVHFVKRDIASGLTLNNSFTGPYPEETDHLHIDKGANP